jgi:LysR family transcriptional activator of nhaA
LRRASIRARQAALAVEGHADESCEPGRGSADRLPERTIDRLGLEQLTASVEDSALIAAFGRAGTGLFALPSAVESQVRGQYGVCLVGRLDPVRRRFYAITVERKVRNPAVIVISERARALFA